MSKLGIAGVTALSLASAVATPAFAVGLRGVHGGSAMHVGSGGLLKQAWYRALMLPIAQSPPSRLPPILNFQPGEA